MVPSQNYRVDEELSQENSGHEMVLRHSKNEPDNSPLGHSVEVRAFSFSPERFSPGKIHNISTKVLGVETPPGWHDCDIRNEWLIDTADQPGR
jgi:hypothetical protein